MLIGKRIKKERTSRKMTIKEMSSILELSPSLLGLIERGIRGTTAYTLYKLAAVFNISVDTIMLEKNETAKDATEARRKKLYSMSHGLGTQELDFLIDTIKAVRDLKK